MNRYINKIENLVSQMENSKPKLKGKGLLVSLGASKPKLKGKGLLAPKETGMAKQEDPKNDTDLVTRVVFALRQQRKGLSNGTKA